jgi:hypothetical protein
MDQYARLGTELEIAKCRACATNLANASEQSDWPGS